MEHGGCQRYASLTAATRTGCAQPIAQSRCPSPSTRHRMHEAHRRCTASASAQPPRSAASLSCVRAAKAPFKRLTSGTGVGGHNRPVFGLCFVQPRSAAAAAAEGIADLADEAHNWRLVSCSMDRSVIGCAVSASVRRSQSAYSAYSCSFAAAGGCAVVVRCSCLFAQFPLAPPWQRLHGDRSSPPS